MKRRKYLRTLGSLPAVAVGVTGCLAGGTNEPSSSGTTGAAKLALTAEELGKAWAYTESGAPTVADSETIVAKYIANDPYPRTVMLRLWPCKGETLEALGSCSLGNLPDRKRANESIDTTTRSFGKTAFLWWEDVTTDIEVVVPNHVFRLTHTPIVETTQEIPSRDARIEELTHIARLQAKKLRQMNRTETISTEQER
jgi:hypothetical protein